MFIETPEENDVLFGRGAPIIRWQGNVKFRELVRQRKAEYLSTRRHAHKDTIAREIIEEIETKRRGRFLKRALQFDANTEEDVLTGIPRQWMLAESELVIEKVKQALRDKDIDRNSRKTSVSGATKPRAKEESKADSRTEPIVPIIQGPSSDAVERQARMPITQPVALSQSLAELQRQLQARATQQPQLGWTDLIHREQFGLSVGMPFAQLPSTRAPAPFNPPSNYALMYSELMRQQNLLQLLLVPDPPRLRQEPSSVNPMEAGLAWLRARQNAEAHGIQQQNIQMAMQEAIRRLAAPTATAAPTQLAVADRQDRAISTPTFSSGNEEEIQGRASPKDQSGESSSDETPPKNANR